MVTKTNFYCEGYQSYRDRFTSLGCLEISGFCCQWKEAPNNLFCSNDEYSLFG